MDVVKLWVHVVKEVVPSVVTQSIGVSTHCRVIMFWIPISSVPFLPVSVGSGSICGSLTGTFLHHSQGGTGYPQLSQRYGTRTE